MKRAKRRRVPAVVVDGRRSWIVLTMHAPMTAKTVTVEKGAWLVTNGHLLNVDGVLTIEGTIAWRS